MSKFIPLATIGALTTAVLILLTFFVAKWTGIDDAGSYFSFVQLAVDIILGPAVIYSLFLAIDASKIAQESLRVSRHQLNLTLEEVHRLAIKPDVDLFFEGNAKEAELVKPGNGTEYSAPALVLLNSGKAIARWYSLELEFPDNLTPSFGQLPGADFFTRREGWAMTRGRKRVIFRSDGTDAIYYNHPLRLIRLPFPMKSHRDYQEQYEISYLIVTDWGDPVKGSLVLRVVSQRQ